MARRMVAGLVLVLALGGVLAGCSTVRSVGVRRVDASTIEVVVPECEPRRAAPEGSVRVLAQTERDGSWSEQAIAAQVVGRTPAGGRLVRVATEPEAGAALRVVAERPDGERALAFYWRNLSTSSFLGSGGRRYPDTAAGRQAYVDDACDLSADPGGKIVAAVGVVVLGAVGLGVGLLLVRGRRRARRRVPEGPSGADLGP